MAVTPNDSVGTTGNIELVYRTGPLLADYGRALVGLALGLAPLVLLQPPLAIQLVLGLLVLLFGAFLLQTWRRQRTAVRLSPTGITLADRAGRDMASRELAWRDLECLRLRYYGSRYHDRGGWLELQLAGGGRRFRLTSALTDFDRVATAAARAAARNDLPLDPTTRVNLDLLLGRSRRA